MKNRREYPRLVGALLSMVERGSKAGFFGIQNCPGFLGFSPPCVCFDEGFYGGRKAVELDGG